MTAPKMVTEREAILRERKAFERGFAWCDAVFDGDPTNAVASFYPLPKVERPRVMADPRGDGHWRVSGGCVEFACANGQWQRYPLPLITSGRAALIADLFATPTERVEDEEDGV